MLCQSVLRELLKQAAEYAYWNIANLKEVQNADSSERLALERSAWRRQMIQYLYTEEFGSDPVPPAEASASPQPPSQPSPQLNPQSSLAHCLHLF